MTSITRYTTPTQVLTLKDIDLSEAQIYVTYTQEKYVATISGEDVSVECYKDPGTGKLNSKISVFLNQNITSSFDMYQDVEVQVNWILRGKRDCSKIARCSVERNLLETILP